MISDKIVKYSSRLLANALLKKVSPFPIFPFVAFKTVCIALINFLFYRDITVKFRLNFPNCTN